MNIKDFKDVKALQSMVVDLWQIIDNIDTAEDIAKSNDKFFRDLVERQHPKRFKILTSDGYELFLPSKKTVDITSLMYILHELASCNELIVKPSEDWVFLLNKNRLSELEAEAKTIPKELVHEFVDGEESERAKIVKVFMVAHLSAFIDEVFDGVFHGKIIV